MGIQKYKKQKIPGAEAINIRKSIERSVQRLIPKNTEKENGFWPMRVIIHG